MTERKYFQIKMNPLHHQRIKERANLFGVSIGTYVENLVSSMERRIEKVKEETDIVTGILDPYIIKILLISDTVPDAEIVKAQLDSHQSLKKYGWKITI